MRPLAVTVYGRARPAGALKIGRAGDGRAFLHHRDGGELREWKNALRDKIGEQLDGAMPEHGPVAVVAYFYFARPRAHYGSGRNAAVLKANAPLFPITRANGDGDKLARALLDALTGVAIADDSQVADLVIAKRYADDRAVSVDVQVRSLPAELVAP